MKKLLDLFPSLKRVPWRPVLFWGLALKVSLILFFVVWRVTACWQLTALPGIPPAYCGRPSQDLPSPPSFGEAGTQRGMAPIAESQAPALDIPHWDGASRINIVFFGLRGGEVSGEGCPACTDTILLLTVDPMTHTAGMLSIPRDLWVNIPGYGYSRINTAWTIGEAAQLPGGGPGLAMKTVSQFIGVPIQYYVQVDFDTFVALIDQIGGIDIYSDEKLKLDPMGAGQDHFLLKCCGLRHLNGRRALAYARCRDESQGCSDGDVGRAKRQQKVILAIRDKILDPTYFPQLLTQAPQLYQTFSSGIHTNLSLEDALKLAGLARDIPLESIHRGVIDNNMVSFATVELDGIPSSVLRPLPDAIRLLRDEIFIPGGPVHPLAQGDALALMQADEARVRIVNNTLTSDLGERTAHFLTEQGLEVVESGPSTGWTAQTVLVLYTPRVYAWRYLIDLFGVQSGRLMLRSEPESAVDIEIRIGEDWVGRLPSGY